MTRVIVHNHLPARAADAQVRPGDKFSEGDRVKLDPAYGGRSGVIVEKSSSSVGIYLVRFPNGEEAYVWDSDMKRVGRSRDVSASEEINHTIEAYYQKLKGMERKALEKLVGGRLDPSHLRSESKGTLINAALNARFNRRDLEAWGK